MVIRGNRTSGLAALALAAFALAGCGGKGTTASGPATLSVSPSATRSAAPLTAQQISGNMTLALSQATSVHITGTWGSGAQRADIDVTSGTAGSFAGTITLSGTPVSLEAVKRRAYVKLTAGFLAYGHYPAAACAQYCGNYIEGPTSGILKQFGDWRLSTIIGYTQASSDASRLGQATVGGQPAWVLHVPASAGGGSPATFYVASHGTPYLLRMVYGTLNLRFSKWNTAVVPPAPPAGSIVPVSQVASA